MIDAAGRRGNSDRVDALVGRTYERSDAVLWSLALPGIVLHNFERRQFLELDDVGYRLWALLDGARQVEEVASRVLEEAPKTPRQCVWAIVQRLVENGFVVERPR